MVKKLLFLLLVAVLLAGIWGCDKEKIVNHTEIVKETEYIESDPDTIFMTDTVFLQGSGGSDTVYITNTVYDTVVQTNNVYDTVTVVNTVTVHDTVVVNNSTTDTVQVADKFLAYTALQSHVDPMVFELIQSEFGLSGGFVLYLSINQNDVQNPSSGVFDVYGYIEYWTADNTGYYPLEYYFRMVYNGGDPTNPNNWTAADPPATSAHQSGGVKLTGDKVLSTKR